MNQRRYREPCPGSGMQKTMQPPRHPFGKLRAGGDTKEMQEKGFFFRGLSRVSRRSVLFAKGDVSRASSLTFLALLATFCLTASSPAATIPVTPASDLQAAIDSAQPGDEVVFAAGTYPLLTAELVVSNSITLRGEDGAAATILDGCGSNRCLRLTTSNAVIEGLTITRGNAAIGGGGISCEGGTIRNCMISENTGCGIRADGPLVIEGTTISGNHGDFGAGIKTTSALSLFGCTISGNVARVDGGGISAGRGVCLVSNTAVICNTSGRSGGGICTSARSDIQIVASAVSSNHAESAEAAYGGGVHVIGMASASVRNSSIAGNSAGFRGGGIYCAGSVTLEESAITGNSAGNRGGGIMVFKDRQCTSHNTAITGNQAPEGADIAGNVQVIQ